MPSTFRNILVLCIVSLVLIGFVITSGIAIKQTISVKIDKIKEPKKEVKPPTFSEPFTYISSILVGLIGGIVAVGFGQSPPTTGGEISNLRKNFRGLGAFILENTSSSPRALNSNDSQSISPKTKETFGLIYSSVYLLVGIATIVTWIYASDLAPNVIKNLATVSIGLFVSIVTTFFKS